VELICAECRKPTMTDSCPRWAVLKPGHYIARNPRCKTPTCTVRYSVPASKDLPWSRCVANFQHLSRFEKKEFNLESYIQPFVDPKKYPSIVECWCIWCKALTETIDGCNSFIDTQARWTISTPPLYVERRQICLRWYRELRHSSGLKERVRFVPIDDTIVSVYRKILQNFHEMYAVFGLDTRRILLGKLPPSSKEWIGKQHGTVRIYHQYCNEYIKDLDE
jgi:hypothetical protein